MTLLASLVAGQVRAEKATTIQARAPLKLIRAPEVQAELGLDAEQVQAIASALEQVDLPLWQLRDLPAEKAGESAQRLSQLLRANLERLLRPGQLARFDQLLLRSAGWHTLQLPSVVGKLQLEPRQQQSYEEFLAAVEKLPNQSFESLARRESAWIGTTLTGAQRQRLNQLLGKPFDFSRATIREVKAPELRGVEAWINSPALSLASLLGKVVVVNFWTFGCINCVHNLPHYKQWYASLPRDRVVQIGIHTPETSGEHDLNRLRRAVQEQGLAYPIAVDNQRTNWTAWGNNIWPSVYLIDKQGYVRVPGGTES